MYNSFDHFPYLRNLQYFCSFDRIVLEEDADNQTTLNAIQACLFLGLSLHYPFGHAVVSQFVCFLFPISVFFLQVTLN